MSAPTVSLAAPPRALARLACIVLLGLAACLAFTSRAHAAMPDDRGFQTLLQRYLKVIGGKGAPYDTRFDYELFYIDERTYYTQHSETLETIRAQMLSVDPLTLTPRERLAWAINAYNFMVIERMTMNLLVPGRKFLRYDSPLEPNRGEGPFFGAPVINLHGVDYSLTGFARRFVYGDSTSETVVDFRVPREHGGDPRLMFALVHAAKGSAPLLPWVYSPDSLDAQLDRATRIALALPTWLKLDKSTGVLSANNRFFMERADLGGPEMPGLMPLLDRFAPAEVRKVIARRKLTRPDLFFEPDWKINQWDRPKPKLPGQAGADSITVKPSR
jgi:hypothetical protein